MYTKDIEINDLLRGNMDTPEAIPEDLLLPYFKENSFGQLYNLVTFTDAFDVFKSSALMPYVKDKSFLIELFQIYNELNNLKFMIDYYREKKEKALPMRDFNKTNIWINSISKNDPYTYYSILLEEEEMRLFVLFGTNMFPPQMLEKIEEKIEQMINRIDQEYLN